MLFVYENVNDWSLGHVTRIAMMTSRQSELVKHAINSSAAL